MGRLSQLYPTAFISGSSSGIGRAFCEMLLAEGVRVWGTSRDLSRLEDLAKAHPGAFFAARLDLADSRGAVSAYRQCAAAAGGAFDLVIENAGYGIFGDFSSVEARTWRAQADEMLGSTLELSHEAFRSMRTRGRGCLVHVSSIAGEFPLPYMSVYNMAKAGLSALSESLIFEARGSSITVIDFRPGDYRTEFNQSMKKGSTTEATQRAWRALDALSPAAPAPARPARDLRRALLRGHSGVVRSGGFFQATAAPFLARFIPLGLRRSMTARYFGA